MLVVEDNSCCRKQCWWWKRDTASGGQDIAGGRRDCRPKFKQSIAASNTKLLLTSAFEADTLYLGDFASSSTTWLSDYESDGPTYLNTAQTPNSLLHSYPSILSGISNSSVGKFFLQQIINGRAMQKVGPANYTCLGSGEGELNMELVAHYLLITSSSFTPITTLVFASICTSTPGLIA
ncbi:uncharacterized protein F5147DRAFT_652019 [Suillus discolor]|uniref:Uncharacterized protein n=1 Tax=Suillus discolor TaxID=1912936 RepID=A0A9P7JVC1_9AGAM|nr:uncharacterized protein F5147DRAFT_652019 [Suillus discolor]KAG2110409.1 hypothetical protein F5147DRAFT_652019 [Suillus discolor]